MSDLWVHPSAILILGRPRCSPRCRSAGARPGSCWFRRSSSFASPPWPRGPSATIPFLQFTLVFGRVDSLSTVFGYIMALMCVLSTLYGLQVKRTAEHIAAWTYVAGSLGAIFAGDLLTLFLFWELMAFSSVFLIWFRGREQSPAAGFRYLLVHVAGGVSLLAGIVLRYHAAGGNLAFVGFDVHHPDLAAYLIMTGFILNAAVPPLHAWLPDAYGEATFSGSVFLCAFTTKTAVYALCRGFAGMEILIVLGVIMALYGVVYAVLENDCRRLLAYHIISQVGYMVAAVGLGTQLAINGAVAHAFAHILYKGLLFMGCGSVLHMTGKSKFTELGGPLQEDALDLRLHAGRRPVHLGIPAFQRLRQQVDDRPGRIRGPQALGRLPPAPGLLRHVPAHGAQGARTSSGSGRTTATRRPGSGRPSRRGTWSRRWPITSGLCIFIGCYTPYLYRMLPYPVDFHPYTSYHISETLQILLLHGPRILPPDQEDSSPRPRSAWTSTGPTAWAAAPSCGWRRSRSRRSTRRSAPSTGRAACGRSCSPPGTSGSLTTA